MSDDELANDRTFLAWLRTSLALIGLGFVVAKVALIVQPTNKTSSHQGLYAAVGIVIVLCGGVLIVVGYLPTQDRAGPSGSRQVQATTALASRHHRFARHGLTLAFRADRRVDVARCST